MGIINRINRKQKAEKKTQDEKIVSILAKNGFKFSNIFARNFFIKNNCNIEHFESGFWTLAVQNKVIFSGGTINVNKTKTLEIIL